MQVAPSPPPGAASGPLQILTDLLSIHGRELCDDPRRLEALLRDLCGEERRAIFVLVNALRERVASDLLGWPEGVPQALLHGRLAGRLATNLGFAPEVALWAAGLDGYLDIVESSDHQPAA